MYSEHQSGHRGSSDPDDIITRFNATNPHLDKHPTGGYYDRQVTASTSVAPAATVKSTEQTVRDALTVATQVMINVTCLAVLISLAYGWYEWHQILAALADFGQQMRGIGG